MTNSTYVEPLPVAVNGGAPKAGVYRWYVLALLTGLSVMMTWDRIIISALFEPIKATFHLTDSQLGLAGGTVYAVFMGIAALPAGYLVDRRNRRNIAAACLAAFSIGTAACGQALSLMQFMGARMVVGVAEAGSGPASISIIADLFERRRRATAMAIFMFGSSIAGLVNLTIGTSLTHAYGWRAALFWTQVPGVVLAALMMVSMREPRRGLSDDVVAPPQSPPLSETIAFMGRQKSLIFLLLGGAFGSITLAGTSSWVFSFVIRVHHLQLHAIGFQLGVGFAVAGLVGNSLGGWLVDRMAQRDERWRFWIIAIAALISVAVGLASDFVNDWTVCFILIASFGALLILWNGSGYALGQSLVEVRMRGVIGGVLFLISNVIGYAVGPPLTGMLSDALKGHFGVDSLRYAMAIVTCLNLVSALCFMIAARWVRADLVRAAQADTPAAP